MLESWRYLALATNLWLAACAGSQDIAPISSRMATGPPRAERISPAPPGYHVVKRGETLGSIARNYGHNYREVAKWNSLLPPYQIYVGQRLLISTRVEDLPEHRSSPGAAAGLIAPLLPPFKKTDASVASSSSLGQPPSSPHERTVSPAPEQIASKATGPKATQVAPVQPEIRKAAGSVVLWQWPTRGELLQAFLAGDKGVSIAGKEGQPIRAAASGRVVYSGTGLIGRGEVVIIKHNKSFLSAYAYNRKILVKEGEEVAAGQPIAEMGRTASDQVMLYFEIRKDGKPVDPLHYLPSVGR